MRVSQWSAIALLCVPLMATGCSQGGFSQLGGEGWKEVSGQEITRTVSVNGGTAKLTAKCDQVLDGPSVNVSMAMYAPDNMPLKIYQPEDGSGGHDADFILNNNPGKTGNFQAAWGAMSNGIEFDVIPGPENHSTLFGRDNLGPDSHLKLKLKLENGGTATVDVQTSDPKFQALLKTCIDDVSSAGAGMSSSTADATSSQKLPEVQKAPAPQAGTEVSGAVTASASSSSVAVVSAPEATLVQGHWTAQPSVEQIAAAYPKRAVDDEVEGNVKVRCWAVDEQGNVDCKVLYENPSGYNFGRVAVALLKRNAKIGVDGDQQLVGAFAIKELSWKISK